MTFLREILPAHTLPPLRRHWQQSALSSLSSHIFYRQEAWHTQQSLKGEARPPVHEMLLHLTAEDGTRIDHTPFLRKVRYSGRKYEAAVDALLASYAAVRAAGGLLPQFSVNAGMPAVQSPFFWQALNESVTASGLTPQQVIIEVLEHGDTAPHKSGRKQMEQALQQGYRLAVDDMRPGAPHDEKRFDALKEMLSFIKISGHVMNNISRWQSYDALAQQLQNLKEKAAGAEIVAEWVQSHDEAETLFKKLPITYVQGYRLE